MHKMIDIVVILCFVVSLAPGKVTATARPHCQYTRYGFSEDPPCSFFSPANGNRRVVESSNCVAKCDSVSGSSFCWGYSQAMWSSMCTLYLADSSLSPPECQRGYLDDDNDQLHAFCEPLNADPAVAVTRPKCEYQPSNKKPPCPFFVEAKEFHYSNTGFSQCKEKCDMTSDSEFCWGYHWPWFSGGKCTLYLANTTSPPPACDVDSLSFMPSYYYFFCKHTLETTNTRPQCQYKYHCPSSRQTCQFFIQADKKQTESSSCERECSSVKESVFCWGYSHKPFSNNCTLYLANSSSSPPVCSQEECEPGAYQQYYFCANPDVIVTTEGANEQENTTSDNASTGETADTTPHTDKTEEAVESKSITHTIDTTEQNHGHENTTLQTEKTTQGNDNEHSNTAIGSTQPTDGNQNPTSKNVKIAQAEGYTTTSQNTDSTKQGDGNESTTQQTDTTMLEDGKENSTAELDNNQLAYGNESTTPRNVNTKHVEEKKTTAAGDRAGGKTTSGTVFGQIDYAEYNETITKAQQLDTSTTTENMIQTASARGKPTTHIGLPNPRTSLKSLASPKWCCACTRRRINSTMAITNDPDVIKKELSVDVKKLSSRRRRKESSPDPRQSSTYIGLFGILFISGLFGLLLLSDVPYIYRNARYGTFTFQQPPTVATN